MKKNNVLLCAASLFLALLIAGAPLHAADNNPKTETREKHSTPQKKKPVKKKTTGTPDRFVPSSKVSADQAVAFPTDI